MNIFKTTDGHEFRNKKDYEIWQSVLDFIERFPEKENIGFSQYSLKAENTKDIEIISNYLKLYLEFTVEEINKMHKILIPSTVNIDLKDKIIEIGEL